MSGSVNRVILIGNLGRDPESRTTSGGQIIVNMTIATSERWKDKAGEQQERTEWHRVVIFDDKLGSVAERFLKKGSSVYIEGRIQTRKWTDKEGQERFSTEVVVPRFGGALVLLGGAGDGARRGGGDDRPSQAAVAGAVKFGQPKVEFEDLDDNIPF